MPSSSITRPVVLVTGAARRLGQAIALDLAENGYDIAVHYRHSSDEAEETASQARERGAKAQCFCADLANEAACRKLIKNVISGFGRLDFLVNNASHFIYDNSDSANYSNLEDHFRVNTAAAIFLSQELANHLNLNNKFGCIVNITDQKLWNQNPDYLSYTISKAALDTATVLLAQALAPRVRVVGVAPGLTLVSGEAMDSVSFSKAHRMTPLGQSSTPEDIANTVRFALKSRAITGTTIIVDGGQHLVSQSRDVAFIYPKL